MFTGSMCHQQVSFSLCRLFFFSFVCHFFGICITRMKLIYFNSRRVRKKKCKSIDRRFLINMRTFTVICVHVVKKQTVKESNKMLLSLFLLFLLLSLAWFVCTAHFQRHCTRARTARSFVGNKTNPFEWQFLYTDFCDIHTDCVSDCDLNLIFFFLSR